MLSRMTHQRIVALDFLVIAWVLFCLMLGMAVTKRINHLGALGDGLVSAGDSVSGVGDWIAGLQDIPLIGGSIGAVADKVDDLGAATAQQGVNGKEAVEIDRLGLTLAAGEVPSRISVTTGTTPEPPPEA